jgi:hypothetical protein
VPKPWLLHYSLAANYTEKILATATRGARRFDLRLRPGLGFPYFPCGSKVGLSEMTLDQARF